MRKEIADQLLAKVRDDYETIAEDFSASRVSAWPEMERIKEFCAQGDRVLDSGCGNGRAYQLFKGMAIEYEGLDASAKLIAHAKENVHDLLVNFRVGDMTALPYESGSFDLVLMIASFHHLPSGQYRLTAMREAQRALKPGGTLFMTNWDRWKLRYWREHVSAFFMKMAGSSPYDFGDIFVPWKRGSGSVLRYYHAFTLRGLAKICQKAGLTVVENYHTAKGVRVPWWKGDNIVTICRKPKIERPDPDRLPF